MLHLIQLFLRVIRESLLSSSTVGSGFEGFSGQSSILDDGSIYHDRNLQHTRFQP